jgi:hypothetical protein
MLITMRYHLRKRQFFLIHHLLSLCQRIKAVVCSHLHLFTIRNYLLLHIFTFLLIKSFIFLMNDLIGCFIVIIHLLHHLLDAAATHNLRYYLRFILYHLIFNRYFKCGFRIID